MRLERPTRLMMVLAGLGIAALAACGLDAIATGDGPGGGPDSTDEGASTGEGGADAPIGDGGQVVLPPLPDSFDEAGLDASQDNCLAACDGGGCDAGWCVLDCAATNSCSSRVVCPPGVPCDVQCTGATSCSQGVDCTAASACRIACSGPTSCANQPTVCSGVACRVDCTGTTSCSQGLACDAGACTLACLGTTSCANQPTVCNANTCNVRCGINLDDGKDACSQGVRCNAAQSCEIACPAHNACRNQPNVAYSRTAVVECLGQGSCNKGSDLSGGDASVLCSGTSACATKTFCDAGNCNATCTNGDDFVFCCKAGSVCNKAQTGCTISASGCP